MFDDVLQVHVIDIFIGHVVDVIRNLPIDVMMRRLERAAAFGRMSHHDGAADSRQTGMTVGALALVRDRHGRTVRIVVAGNRRGRDRQNVLGDHGIAPLTVFLKKEGYEKGFLKKGMKTYPLRGLIPINWYLYFF